MVILKPHQTAVSLFRNDGTVESEPNRGRALSQIDVCMGGVCCIAGRLRLGWLPQQPIGGSHASDHRSPSRRWFGDC